MHDKDVVNEIREALLAACEPWAFPPPWDFLPPHSDVRQIPETPEELLASLRKKKFSEEKLLAAGIAERDDRGKLRLPAKLAAAGALLVACREQGSGEVIDLLTEEGSVLEEDLPFFTALRGDLVDLGPAATTWEIVACFDIAEVALLRACGIPATLAAGLEKLSRTNIERLCRALDLECDWSERQETLDPQEKPYVEDPAAYPEFARAGQGGPAAAGGAKPAADPGGTAGEERPRERRLVFLGWSPSGLGAAMPPQIETLAAYFRQLEEHLGMESPGEMWRTTPQGLKRLEFMLGFREVRTAAEALLDSLSGNTWSLPYPKETTELPRAGSRLPADLPDAAARLREITLRPSGDRREKGERQREMVDHLERLFEEQVVAPMMAQALRSADPAERASGVTMAQLAAMLFREQTGFLARDAAAQEDSASGLPEPLSLQEMKPILALHDRFCALLRENRRWQESTSWVTIPARPLPPDAPLGLPPCG